MLFCLYYSWQKNLYFFVCPKKLYVTFLYDVILGHTVVGKKLYIKCCICELVRVKLDRQ